ncbi:MAG TPA: hypothetical protein VFW87_12395 [Pirellulales bacterium]|nr:hypothetical protein [Pirellulales bacterium]
MREHLLGYLLGALEPAEREWIDARLADDAGLRYDLARLREKLEVLGDDDERAAFEPPSGLAGRTCNYVAARAAATSGRIGAPVSGWRVPDLLVGGGIFIAACMLLFPAIANSRFQARIVGCQDNLRSIGVALTQYADYHGGYFPLVPERGPLAAAGVYAPVLSHSRLLDNPAVFVCPASRLAEAHDGFCVPSLEELRQAAPQRLVVVHRKMGGSYGYTFGYLLGGRYLGHRNRGRSGFALMADSPDDPTGGASQNHDACGQNVLFEDAHVQFLKRSWLPQGDDHIYVNRVGCVGAGLGPDDSVIGRSSARPLVLPGWPAP